MTKEPILIETEDLTLEEWLALIAKPPQDSYFIDYCFPTENHFQEYLAAISERKEQEVIKLLRSFLIHTGTLGIDEHRFSYLAENVRRSPDGINTILNREYNRRLFAFATKKSQIPPWEGITWALDLLPHFPQQAIDAIGAYFLAHAQQLPDGRLVGLSQAMAIIRAKFIGNPGDKEEAIHILLEMDSRRFEHLVERLYGKMGYETRLTPPQKDKGRDIIAITTKPGKSEHLLVECKRYSNPVGVEIARALLGVIADEKVNKGTIVTTSRFTRGAKELAQNNPRLELIDGEQLVLLLNENLGTRWPLHIDLIVLESQKLYQ